MKQTWILSYVPLLTTIWSYEHSDFAHDVRYAVIKFSWNGVLRLPGPSSVSLWRSTTWCFRSTTWRCHSVAILEKVIKIFATRGKILRHKCTKFYFGWGFVPDTAGEITARDGRMFWQVVRLIVFPARWHCLLTYSSLLCPRLSCNELQCSGVKSNGGGIRVFDVQFSFSILAQF